VAVCQHPMRADAGVCARVKSIFEVDADLAAMAAKLGT